VRNHPPRKGIDECRRCVLFRDSVQFCSGLVELVVGVGHHGDGGIGFARAGERFLGLLPEALTKTG
jgi:hypothetical protein